MRRELSEQEVYVETKCGYVVDYVDRGCDELELAGGGYESDDYLEGEPCVADAFDVEEDDVSVCVHLFGDLVCFVCWSSDSLHTYDWDFHIGMGLQAE